MGMLYIVYTWVHVGESSTGPHFVIMSIFIRGKQFPRVYTTAFLGCHDLPQNHLHDGATNAINSTPKIISETIQ